LTEPPPLSPALSPAPAPAVRLFAALDLPDEMRGRLLAWGAGALSAVPGTRLQRPEAMHVTLCFLGGQPAANVGAIADAMRRAVDARSAVTLTAVAAIWLPPRRPRVAAAQLADATGELAALQASLATALADGAWFSPERRRFLPHVTVARVGRRGPPHPPELAPPPAVSATAHSVSLYCSHTGPAGARYEPLATVRLVPGRRAGPRSPAA
jgi:2'-5' RNA ligase